METILSNGLTWLTKHVPGVALVGFVMISVVWVTVLITDFNHRLAETERLCNDINTRQLPEIRAEMDRRFSEVDKRLLRIEMQLNTIITYIETKEGLKPNSLKPKFP